MWRLLGVLALAALAGGTAPATAQESSACGVAGYSYAGFASAKRAHGVRADLTAVREPSVVNGHVAAWVGVGGVGEGPNGSDSWLQVGVSSIAGLGESGLYYEVTRPGEAPRSRLVHLSGGRLYRQCRAGPVCPLTARLRPAPRLG
jgi:hypothetical protein